MIGSSTQAQPRFASPAELLSAIERVAVVALPSLFAIWAVVRWMPSTNEGVDFWQFYAAAVTLLHGEDIYSTLGSLGQSHALLWQRPLAWVLAAIIVVAALRKPDADQAPTPRHVAIAKMRLSPATGERA